MRNKSIVLAVSFLAVSIASCGKLESRKKSTQPITETPMLTMKEFKEQCAKANGRLSADDNYCLTRVLKDLPAGITTRYQIVPEFFAGQQVVTTGEGNVSVLYEGSQLLTVPERKTSEIGDGGELAFYVNSGNYKNVSASVWSCFDRTYDAKNDRDQKKMQRIFCPPRGVVP
jgi:hypothetical protein